MPKTFYIAIVCKDLSDTACKRSAFTAPTKQKAILLAMEARDEWHHKGNGPYKIFVGELYKEVVVPPPIVDYEEVGIK